MIGFRVRVRQAVIALGLITAASGIARSQATFPLLDQLAGLNQAVTPHEYALMQPAMLAALGNDNDWRGPAAMVFANGHAQRVALGTLGTGYIFQGLGGCGATGNCTVAVVYPKPGGGWAAYVSGGDGLMLAGTGPVPDVYITWHMSAETGNISRLRYGNGAYVAAGGEEYDNEKPVSEDGAPTFPIPRYGNGTAALGPASLSPDEYAQLRAPVLAALRAHLTAAAAEAAFDHAHGLEQGGQSWPNAMVVLKAGDCDVLGNCSILRFRGTMSDHRAEMPTASRFVLLASPLRGWSAAAAEYVPPLFGPEVPAGLMQLTVARRLSSSSLFLEHDQQVPADRFGPKRFAVDGCAQASGNIGAPDFELRAAACSIPAPPTRAIPVDSSPVGTVSADSTGGVWATERLAQSCAGKLYRWSAGHWLAQAPPRADVTLDQLRAVPGGGVLASWRTCAGAEPPIAIDRLLRGDHSTAQSPGEQPPQGAIATALGILVPVGGDQIRAGYKVNSMAWAPGHEPGLARWTSEAAPVRVFTYDDSQFRLWPDDSNQWPGPGALYALTDSAATTWIWGSGFAHGVLLVRNGTVEQRQEIPGLPDGPIRTLADYDAAHIAAVMDVGLYLIDIHTAQAAPVTPPEPGAFNAVEAVFSAGGDHYVEAGHGRGPTEGVAGPLALWRLRNGRWQQVITDTGQYGCCLLNNSTWAWNSAGLWISALPSGIWRVPHDGPVELIDWTHGLPLGGSISRLIALDPDHLFAVDGRGHSTLFDVNSVLAVKPPATDFSLTNVAGTLARDQRGHVWALRRDALAEWNGHSWAQHALPAGLTRARLSGVNVDSDRRIWLLPGCGMGPVAIYSPEANTWSATYSDYRNELAQQIEGRHFLNAGDFLAPAQSPGGAMAFFGPCGALNYFNGQHWRIWQPNELQRDMSGSRGSNPGFDANGNLILTIDENYDNQDQPITWKWDGTEWVKTAAGKLPPYQAPWRHELLAPPPGCSTPWPDSLTFDARGRGWWTAGGNLYVGVAGRCRVVLQASEIQPFIDGRGIVAVTLDGFGNTFVSTDLPDQVIFIPGATQRPKN